MTFLLMILLPWAMAAGCFALRPNTRLGISAALATLGVVIIFLVNLPLDEPVRSLGIALAIDRPGQVLIGALLLAVGTAYVAWTALPVGENTPASLLVVLGLVLAALLFQSAVPALTLLLMAAALGILLIVDTRSVRATLRAPREIAAAVIRLVLLMIGTLLLVMGYTLSSTPPNASSFGTILMWTGVAIWAGLIPFHVTLADLAEDTTPYVFLCAVVLPQAVVLAVFERMSGTQPLIAPGVSHLLLLVATCITIVGAPLLARGTVRRAMAFVLLGNVGQIVLGMVLDVSAGGVSLVASHVLSAALICSSIALLEVHVPGQSTVGEPWRERPIAAAGLVIGLLLLLGVPGVGSFAPKLTLWQAAWRDGALAFGILAVGTVLLARAAIQLVRALLFTPAERREADRRAHWRRRVAPGGTPASDVATLPVVVPSYVPITLRSWTVLLIVIAVATAIDTLLPS
jgi:NADH-quinone oxidoreductase subunit N